jgi:ABC-type glycerol-3-phosphate transport system permease component
MKRFHLEVKVVHIIYGIFMLLTGSVWLVRPSYLAQEEKNTTLNGKPQLPLGGWSPFDLNSPITYLVTIVLQVIIMLMNGFGLHGCNLLFLMTAMFISKLMAYLNYQLALVPQSKNIKKRICELGMYQDEVFKYVKSCNH